MRCSPGLLLALALSASAAERSALVIGNARYDEPAELKNPGNDADAIAAALTQLGFQVSKKTDLDLDRLEDAVVEFRKSIAKGGVALFFYAGHGVQVKGENYLVPLKAKIKEEFQVKDKCYKVDQVLAALDDSEAALKVVILDCCRVKPFSRGWTRGRSAAGLASIADVPDGTLIAFATAAGQTALDGRGANSPYTTALVKGLASRPAEGLEIKDVLFEASRAVFKETGQRPWINVDGSLEKYFLWRGGSAPPPKIAAPREKPFTNSVGMKLVPIPPGECKIGSPATEKGREAEGEEPRRLVRIESVFYLGEAEVTRGQFLTFYHAAKYKTEAETDGEGGWGFLGDKDPPFGPRRDFVLWNTNYPQTDNHPAVNVSWNDTLAFCKWLSAKEGRTYRLPTEEEWEYACRGGTTTRYSFGDNDEDLVTYANAYDATAIKQYRFHHAALKGSDGFAFAAPVKSFRANPFGLYDMHGNVHEWCSNWYRSESNENPHHPWQEPRRVVRGGDFVLTSGTRSAARTAYLPNSRTSGLGFRVACDAP